MVALDYVRRLGHDNHRSTLGKRRRAKTSWGAETVDYEKIPTAAVQAMKTADLTVSWLSALSCPTCIALATTQSNRLRKLQPCSDRCAVQDRIPIKNNHSDSSGTLDQNKVRPERTEGTKEAMDCAGACRQRSRLKRQLEQKLTMTRLLGTAPLKRIAPASCVRLYSNGEGNIQESFGTPATHECSINSAVTAIEQFSCPEAELERAFCYQWVNILFPPIGRPTIVPQAWEADWRTRLIISLSKQVWVGVHNRVKQSGSSGHLLKIRSH